MCPLMPLPFFGLLCIFRRISAKDLQNVKGGRWMSLPSRTEAATRNGTHPCVWVYTTTIRDHSAPAQNQRNPNPEFWPSRLMPSCFAEKSHGSWHNRYFHQSRALIVIVVLVSSIAETGDRTRSPSLSAIYADARHARRGSGDAPGAVN